MHAIFFIDLSFRIEYVGQFVTKMAQAHHQYSGCGCFIEVADQGDVVGDQFKKTGSWVKQVDSCKHANNKNSCFVHV